MEEVEQIKKKRTFFVREPILFRVLAIINIFGGRFNSETRNKIAQVAKISYPYVNQTINHLLYLEYIVRNNGQIEITKRGQDCLQIYMLYYNW